MKIPFNLHDAIDGKPVINGKGEDFQFEAYYPGTNYPVVGTIRGVELEFTIDGRSYPSDKYDLFMKPEKITRWILVSKDSGQETKEAFTLPVSDFAAALIKVEFYPGEGLE